MFGITLHGQIHQLLNNEDLDLQDLNRHDGSKYCQLIMLLCVNDQLCQQFCLRKSGTNVYLCDRILLFSFTILLIGVLSLYAIVFFLQPNEQKHD